MPNDIAMRSQEFAAQEGQMAVQARGQATQQMAQTMSDTIRQSQEQERLHIEQAQSDSALATQQAERDALRQKMMMMSELQALGLQRHQRDLVAEQLRGAKIANDHADWQAQQEREAAGTVSAEDVVRSISSQRWGTRTHKIDWEPTKAGRYRATPTPLSQSELEDEKRYTDSMTLRNENAGQGGPVQQVMAKMLAGGLGETAAPAPVAPAKPAEATAVGGNKYAERFATSLEGMPGGAKIGKVYRKAYTAAEQEWLDAKRAKIAAYKKQNPGRSPDEPSDEEILTQFRSLWMGAPELRAHIAAQAGVDEQSFHAGEAVIKPWLPQ